MIRYVTSFSRDGYERYGRRMLEGLLNYWPEGEIFVYHEDKEPDLVDSRLVYKNLFDIEGLCSFLETAMKYKMMRGMMPDGKYSYRYDVFKFCRKSFAQIDAFEGFNGTLIWIDADIETLQPIPEHWFEEWLGESAMAYLGRKEWHLCASFLMWDCLRKETSEFFRVYKELYTDGTLFAMPEWHDSFLVESLIHGMNMPSVNLTGSLDIDGPYNVFDKAFEDRARHLKGNLKRGPRRYTQLIDAVRDMQPERIVEIGTWNGERALEMHAVSPKSEYFGFDLFEQGTDETDAAELNVKPHCRGQEVAFKLQQHGVSFALYAGFSSDTLPEYIKQVGEKSAQLVFVDGGHSVETIKSDFEYAKLIVAPGGLIVLDDYYEGRNDTDRFGCNFIVDGNPAAQILPIADPVADGGQVRMVLIREGDLNVNF